MRRMGVGIGPKMKYNYMCNIDSTVIFRLELSHIFIINLIGTTVSINERIK